MKIFGAARWIAVLALAAPVAILSFENVGVTTASRIIRLAPDTAKPGDIVIAYGQGLGTSRIADLSLTEGRGHALVTILEQTETSIRFRVPAMLTAGRYILVIHPANRYRDGIEQPVTLTVK